MASTHKTKKETGKSLPKEGREFIICRLCRKAFRAIAAPHLIHIHRFDPEHPREEYRRRFREKRLECENTRQKRIQSLHDAYDQQGRHWNKKRVRQEIHLRARRKEPLNASAIRQEWPILWVMACRFYYSWDKALASSGIDSSSVRLHKSWNRKTILAKLREWKLSGLALGHGACNQRSTGLTKAARRDFGSWDHTLRAAGLEPEEIRIRPRWNRRRIVQAIQSTKPFKGRRQPSGALYKAAYREFGGWGAALRAAGYQSTTHA